MFKTSTSMLKGQVPGATVTHLLNFYKRELNHQSVSHTAVKGNTLFFSNKAFKLVLNRYANNFASFSFGQITVTETEKEFIIHMEANMTKLFINAGVIAGAMSIFLLFGSGFNVFPPILGMVVFVLLTIIGYLLTIIFFPVYFINLRNKIQRELETMQNNLPA